MRSNWLAGILLAPPGAEGLEPRGDTQLLTGAGARGGGMAVVTAASLAGCFCGPDCLVLQQRKVVGQSQAASATRQRGAWSRGQSLAVEGEEKPGASAPQERRRARRERGGTAVRGSWLGKKPRNGRGGGCS